MPPGASDEQLVRLELIDMGPTLMVLAVGQHGRVDKQIVDRPEHIDADGVAAAERRLSGPRADATSTRRPRCLQLAAERAPRASTTYC